eukprot:gene4471-4725_t
MTQTLRASWRLPHQVKQLAAARMGNRSQMLLGRMTAPAAGGAGGYGKFKFLSKTGAAAARRPFRRVVNGKLVRARPRAPHMAGQGAEFLDGFADEQLLAVVKAVWGHTSFRGRQLELIRGALAGRSMLGVLPTGLGKSLTYQVPALLLQGLVVVVSPLLALMRDQLSRLPPGLPGAMHTLNLRLHQPVLQRAESGQLRLLYVAPEKLSAFAVMSCLRRLSPLPLVCIDEAHCMAEWGQGFRPAYFRLGHLLSNVLMPRAVLALTATATPTTRACICQLLNIPLQQQLVDSPLRDNLKLEVVHCSSGSSKGGGIAAKVTQLLTTENENCDSLAMPDVPAGHGAFQAGTIRVVVATVAFGMGIDKPDLEAVLHTALPHSLEEYVQQVGRAGRDGRSARCLLFLDDADYLRLRALSHANSAPRTNLETFLCKVFGREADLQQQTQGEQLEVNDAGRAKRQKKAPLLAPSQHRALPLAAACAEMDLSEEVLEGCLSFLQADPQEPFLTALPNCAASLDVRFHTTPPEQLAAEHPVVAAILKAKSRKYAGTYKVHLPALLAAADRPPGELLAELSKLAAAREVGLDLGKQGALVWRLERQPQHWEALVDQLHLRLDQVRGAASEWPVWREGGQVLGAGQVSRVVKVLRASVARLDECYAAVAAAAIYSSQPAQERHLRSVIEEYFLEGSAEEQQKLQELTEAAGNEHHHHHHQQQHDVQQPPLPTGVGPLQSGPPTCSPAVVGSSEPDGSSAGAGVMAWGGVDPVQRPSRDSLRRQMRAALLGIAGRARDLGRTRFTGLALARFVAGLGSPAVPGSFWKGCSEWGRLAAVDFQLLRDVGQEVVWDFWAAEQERQK